MSEPEINRRTMLKAAAIAGASGLAGCSSSSKTNENNGGTDTTSKTTTTYANTTEESSSLPEGGHMKVGWGQGLQSLSPYKGYQADYLAKETMYDRLTRVNRDFEVEPNLAKDWESNEDATEWTFHLVEDATFSNTGGENVTADDVKATVDFMRSDECAGCAKDLASLETLEVVDEYTVKAKLSTTDTEFPRRISETGSTFCIAPKSVLEDDPKKLEETDYGSGPFEMATWEKGNKIVFEARDSYHLEGVNGNSLPYIDKMTWNVQPDAIARVNSLSDGRVDALSRLPPKLVDRAKENATIKQRPSGLQIPIVLNTTIEPFSKPKVRKAIKYATDREQLLDSISGRGKLGHHASITPIHKYYDDDLAPGATFGTTANVEKAKQLLSEAGYGGGVELPPLHYDTGRPEKQVFAQVFQQQMKAAGLNFEIKKLTEEKWLSEYWNQDDVWYISNWSTRVVDSTIPLLALHSDGKWNTTRWSNADYDAALDKAVSATDSETRAKHLAECQRIVHEEGPWVSTVYLDIFGAHKESVSNYKLFPTLIKDFLQYCAVNE